MSETTPLSLSDVGMHKQHPFIIAVTLGSMAFVCFFVAIQTTDKALGLQSTSRPVQAVKVHTGQAGIFLTKQQPVQTINFDEATSSSIVDAAMAEIRPPVSQAPAPRSLGLGLLGLAAAGTAALCQLRRGAAAAAAPLRPSASGRIHDWAPSLTAMLLAIPPEAAFAAEQSTTGYSPASYYTALGTYLIALPGLVSLVTRSVKPKMVKKTFVMPGPNAPGGMAQKDIAGKLLYYLTTKRSFELKDAGKVVTFRGKLGMRRGQAAFLTICVFLSMLSLGLVLQTIEAATLGEGQGLGNWWYALSLISPLAGKYYLDNAGGEQEMQLKIVTNDDETETEVVIQGDDAEVEGVRLEFDWQEKGMVRVKGIFEEQLSNL